MLLASRLRAAGIAATLTLLRPYPHAEVDADLPGLEAFNHAIVYLPGDKSQWIDPTSQYMPSNRLPLGDQERAALIVDGTVTTLTKRRGRRYMCPSGETWPIAVRSTRCGTCCPAGIVYQAY